MNIFDIENKQWEELDQKNIDSLLEEVNSKFRPLPLSEEMTVVKKRKLSFYGDYSLYAFTDMETIPPVTKYVLYSKGKPHVINYSNGPIYAANEDGKFKLNDKNIHEYILFFFNYVQGPHGKFSIVENIDGLTFTDKATSADKDALKKLIKPMDIEKVEDGFRTKAYFIFRESLVKAGVEVKSDGVVKINDPEILMEKVPVYEQVLM